MPGLSRRYLPTKTGVRQIIAALAWIGNWPRAPGCGAGVPARCPRGATRFAVHAGRAGRPARMRRWLALPVGARRRGLVRRTQPVGLGSGSPGRRPGDPRWLPSGEVPPDSQRPPVRCHPISRERGATRFAKAPESEVPPDSQRPRPATPGCPFRAWGPDGPVPGVATPRARCHPTLVWLFRARAGGTPAVPGALRAVLGETRREVPRREVPRDSLSLPWLQRH
jgi:hypothetical protein